MKLTPAEQLFYSTVKISVIKAGKETDSGTGFFYKVPFGDDKAAMVLVTNKHVVAGADGVVVFCHQSKPGIAEPIGNKFVRVELGFSAPPIEHPDPDVDLCAIPFSSAMHKASESLVPLFLVNLDKSLIPKPEDWEFFDAIEEVLMIGCPNGIYDEVNRIPLARRGITATPISKRYNGAAQFLVDMACFPGSSGSPVFVFNVNGYVDRKIGSYRVGAQRVLFVGVLFAGPIVINDGLVVFSKPQLLEVETAMHLGNVIRSNAVLELEDIVRERADTEAARINPA